MKAKLTRAHCFIAVLSGANPNVMIEVGRMEALGRPILLIQHDDHQLPADLTGRLYDTVSDIGELPQQARKVLDRHPAFTDQSGEPFLSASVLTGAGLRDDDARQLARIFSSCRELAGADPDTLGRRLGMAPGLILVAQSHVQSVLNVRN
jgi:hypothetical protein